MIIEELAGRLSEKRFAGLEVDYVDIEWQNAHKKIARVVTRGGLELGLRLSEETARLGLRQDYVVCADEKTVVAVNILPCECISVKVDDLSDLVRLCYEIGNRHAPFFYGEGMRRFLLPYDGPMFAMVEKQGLSPEVVVARLSPERRISGAHGHGHGHHEAGLTQ
jgi:urease accessory protein